MLAHPDLITSAPANYKGMRECCAPNWSWKYSFADIFDAIGSGQQTWNQWGKVQTTTGNVQQMPQYISAYMALLDGAHPFYRCERHTLWPKERGYRPLYFPPLTTVKEEDVRSFMDKEEINDSDVYEAFGWDPMDTRHYSVRTLGNDGVRWGMLQLMSDAHPYLVIQPRNEGEGVLR